MVGGRGHSGGRCEGEPEVIAGIGRRRGDLVGSSCAVVGVVGRQGAGGGLAADGDRGPRPDLDLPGRWVRVREPVGPDKPEWGAVSELTSLLLGRVIGDLTSGPLFFDGRKRVTCQSAFSVARSRAETGLHASAFWWLERPIPLRPCLFWQKTCWRRQDTASDPTRPVCRVRTRQSLQPVPGVEDLHFVQLGGHDPARRIRAYGPITRAQETRPTAATATSRSPPR